MSGELRLQPLGANGRSILIAGAMGNEGLVGDVQGKIAFFGGPTDMKGVLAGERLRLEADVLDNNAGAHLAPGTNTLAASVGSGFTALTRLARRRFGGVPSAASTTIRLVTKSLRPCASKSMVVRSEPDSVMTPQPY